MLAKNLICKSNVAIYQGNINFRKEAPKSLHFAEQNGMSKIQSFSYRIRIVKASNFFSIDIHKIVFPFLHRTSKESVSYFSDAYLHGKNQNDVCIFLLENPLIKNS